MINALSSGLQPVLRVFSASAFAGLKFAGPVVQSQLWVRRRWLRLLGWPGVAGVGLLSACAAFYFSVVQPAEANLSTTHRDAISIQERVKEAAKGLNRSELPPAEQLAAFYRIFPGDKHLLTWLGKIFVVAQSEGITLDQGEYKLTRDRIGKLVRFQATLPVKGEYPQIRKFLSHLRTEIPIVAVEHLQFERQKVDAPTVEAKIILALYLEHEP